MIARHEVDHMNNDTNFTWNGRNGKTIFVISSGTILTNSKMAGEVFMHSRELFENTGLVKGLFCLRRLLI